jgi:hypothetical protein
MGFFEVEGPPNPKVFQSLDGIGQKLPRTTAQNFSKRILKCTWLGEYLTILSWVTAYLPLMESGASNTPRYAASPQYAVTNCWP